MVLLLAVGATYEARPAEPEADSDFAADDFARLGMDAESDQELMWIARAGLKAKKARAWRWGGSRTGGCFFCTCLLQLLEGTPGMIWYA